METRFYSILITMAYSPYVFDIDTQTSEKRRPALPHVSRLAHIWYQFLFVTFLNRICVLVKVIWCEKEHVFGAPWTSLCKVCLELWPKMLLEHSGTFDLQNLIS